MCSSPPWAVCPARRPLAASTCAARVLAKDGFGSDMDKIGSECHILPHFNPDTNANANANLIEYEYKTDSSNPDSDPDTFLI